MKFVEFSNLLCSNCFHDLDKNLNLQREACRNYSPSLKAIYELVDKINSLARFIDSKFNGEFK